MDTMPPEVLSYLQQERVGVLAVQMLDGSPHAATVHFAHTESPCVFYFETYRTYRKAEPILKQPVTRASLVIGADEKQMKTLQLDGEVRRVTDEQIINDIYLAKFPNKVAKRAADPDNIIFFSFTPTWWRFTDWNQPKEKRILTSS
jgi:general stress protein 26